MDLVWNVFEEGAGLHPTVIDAVVLFGVGVCGLVFIGDDQTFEPFHGFEDIGLWHDDEHRSAALAGQPFSVDLVTENDG